MARNGHKMAIYAFHPTDTFIDSAHQNDRQNLSFVGAIIVVGEKMTGNGRNIYNS
jgi:hypothetical protein